MRHLFLYITGLCLGISFTADAAGLPANPWLQEANQNIVRGNQNKAESSGLSAAQAEEMAEKAHQQLENYGNMLQQATNEALPEAKAAVQTQEMENLPSWHEIMEQITPERSTADTAPQEKESPTASFDPAGMIQISKAVSDAQAQYNRAKATTGAYYKQAKNKLKQLEREAQNSVNEVQKIIQP